MKLRELLQLLNSKKSDPDVRYEPRKTNGKIVIATLVRGETTSISSIQTMLAQARTL